MCQYWKERISELMEMGKGQQIEGIELMWCLGGVRNVESEEGIFIIKLK